MSQWILLILVLYVQSLVRGTLCVKSYIDQAVVPDSTQPHCLFNQRQIFQVMDGLQLVTPSVRPRHFRRQAPAAVWKNDRQAAGGEGASNPAQGRRRRGPAAASMAIKEDAVTITPPMLRTVVRLWCHEMTCVYMDALNTGAKQDWFSNILQQTVSSMFCGAKVQEDGHITSQQKDSRDKPDVPSSTSRAQSNSRRIPRSDSRTSTSGVRKKTTARRSTRKTSGVSRGGKTSSRGTLRAASGVDDCEDADDEF